MTSCISRFYRLSMSERRARIGETCGLDADELARLVPEGGLDEQQAERMVENALGVFGLPFGVCVNLRINGVDVLAPMVVEEPSVIAACSYAAKLLRAGRGVEATCSDPIVVGQIQLLEVPDPDAAEAAILGATPELLALASGGHPRLVAAGGGARALRVRRLPRLEADDPCGDMLVVHLAVDVRDAMGANAVNSMCERLAPRIAELSGGRVALRILSNLSDERTVTVVGRVPFGELDGKGAGTGAELAARIEEASVFAERDPYRACTHNKGIMNGVDATLIALGQDWRAVEAGAHAHAAASGRYTAMARWRAEAGQLVGRMTLPLAVGTVGGVVRSHPVVPIARRIAGIEHAVDVAQLCAAVGLAQNLGALRALAAEGIQKGHMRLHARNVAVEAGAAEHEVLEVARRIADAGRVDARFAAEVIEELRAAPAPAAIASYVAPRPRAIRRPSTPPAPVTPIGSRPRSPSAPTELHALEGRAFVAGASGHAGANVVRRLLDEGLVVRVADDLRAPALRGLRVERAASVAGCRFVVACDLEPRELDRILREASRAGAARVVVIEVDAPSAAGEELVRDAAARGLDAVLVRAPRVVGPHDHAPSPLSEALVLHAHGSLRSLDEPSAPFVSARDLSEATVLALGLGRAGETYAVVTEHLDADGWLALFEEVTGRPRPRRPLRARFGRLGRAPSVAAICAAATRRELGFTPTDLRRAIHEAHADLARRGLVPARAGTTEAPLFEAPSRPSVHTATGS